MESQTEEVKQRIDIVDFISQYLQLKQAGQNWRGLCPFHHEKTPSFMVNKERQIYKCFGCGEGGDIFDFVQKIEALNFYDSLKFLADRAGVELKKLEGQKHQGPSADSKLVLYRLNMALARLYHTLLIKHPIGQKALSYARDRGLDDATTKQFLIGYAPSNSTGVKEYIQKNGFTAQDLNNAGNPERFANRLMFPIFDTVGNVVGFTGRSLAKDQEPKYLNTRETAIFHKARILYGFNIAKRSIREHEMAVLVEGQMDVVMSHLADIDYAVATSGTALTDDHLLLIRRQTNRVTLAFDSDDAGFKTTLKAIEMAWRLSLETRVVVMPEGYKDAGDLVKKDPKLWGNAVTQAQPAYDWLWQKLSALHLPSTTAGKKDLMRLMAPIVTAVADPVEKDDYIRRLSRGLGVGEAAARAGIDRVKTVVSTNEASYASKEKQDGGVNREWLELLALLTIFPVKIGDVKEVLGGKIGSGKMALVYEAIFQWYDKRSPNLPAADLVSILPKELVKPIQTLALKLEKDFDDHDAITKDIDERLKRLEGRRREKIKTDFASQIAAAEQSGDITRVKELVKQLQEKTK
jgi:DNA primase